MLDLPVKWLYGYGNDAIEETRQGGPRLCIYPYGSGKTRIAYAWARDRPTNPKAIFVLCPAHNVAVWINEIKALGLNWPVRVNTTEQNTVDNRDPRPTVFIIPWHRIATVYDAWARLKAQYPDAVVIADESTRIKDPTTKRTAAAIKFSRLFRYTHRFALTGNPRPERDYNIWTQFQFVYGPTIDTPRAHNPLGDSFYAYRNQWYMHVDYEWVLKHELRARHDEIMFRYSLWMDRHQYAEYHAARGVDRVNYVTEYWTPTRQQTRLMAQLLKDWELPLYPNNRNNEEVIEYIHAMDVAQKSQQICSGFYYQSEDDGSRTPLFLDKAACPKTTLMVDILSTLFAEDSKRKVVIWYNYIIEHHAVMDALRNNGKCSIISHREHPECLEGFRNNNINIVLIHQSKAEGINELSCADTDIFFSNSYSTNNRDQAEARLNRIGQVSNVVTHIDMVSDCFIDGAIITALQSKSFSRAKLIGIVESRRNIKEID